MGMGASNVEVRLAASVGELENGVAPDFQPARDVPNGGVLCGLPALLAVGLLKTTGRFFKLPKGYYALESLFLLLAFIALAHRKTHSSTGSIRSDEHGRGDRSEVG